MPFKRPTNTNASFCLVLNKLYAFGGDTTANSAKCVESLDLSGDSALWTPEPEMPSDVSRPFPVHSNGSIYLLSPETILEFDLDERRWKSAGLPAFMRNATIVNAVAFRGQLFFFHYNRVSIFDPSCDAWKLPISSPLKPGSNLLNVVLRQGNLTAITRGLPDQYSSQDSMYIYNPSTGQWGSLVTIGVRPISESNKPTYCLLKF
jgi:hypothetical protein